MLQITVLESTNNELTVLAYWPTENGSATCEILGEMPLTTIRAIVKLAESDCFLEFRNKLDDIVYEGTNKDVFLDILASHVYANK